MSSLTTRVRKTKRKQADSGKAADVSASSIWERLLWKNAEVPLAVAKYFLKFDFPEPDHQRMAELNRLANEGQLSVRERLEMEEYIRVGSFVSVMRSKARQALAKHGQHT